MDDRNRCLSITNCTHQLASPDELNNQSDMGHSESGLLNPCGNGLIHTVGESLAIHFANLDSSRCVPDFISKMAAMTANDGEKAFRRVVYQEKTDL